MCPVTAGKGAGAVLGLYEPIHGSAPDIAGQGIANPIGTVLSMAMLLRHSLGLKAEAKAVEDSVEGVLAEGYRTPDIAADGAETVSTRGARRRDCRAGVGYTQAQLHSIELGVSRERRPKNT